MMIMSKKYFTNDDNYCNRKSMQSFWQRDGLMFAGKGGTAEIHQVTNGIHHFYSFFVELGEFGRSLHVLLMQCRLYIVANGQNE